MSAEPPSPPTRPRSVLNINEIELSPWGNGGHYEARLGQIAPRVGAEKLGYNLTVLAPGKSAFPLHAHRVNEEMFFVVDGEGEVQIGDARYPIKKGDVIACPPGGPAHRITNTSSAELRYLGVSTRQWPEVADYPTTGKIGVLAEVKTPDGAKVVQRLFAREFTSVDEYWKGEEP
jgi:uncharacterized cupin superfamily protein